MHFMLTHILCWGPRLPTITELWMADPGSNPENISVLVHNVSTRDLLSMQGGIYDYNDDALEQWTMDHPCAGPNATTPCDIAPTTYMTNMTHRLPDCPIGVDCAMYSGNSFVLAGFVLAAAQGAKTFEEFDVLGLVHDVLPPGTPRFNRTLFMGPGPCSAHPHVVHQYGTRPPAHHHDDTQVERGLGARFARSQGHLIAHESGHAPHTAAISGWNPSGSEAHARAHCGWWSPIQQGMAAEGTVLAVKTLGSAGDCCNFSTALGWPRGANLTWSYSSTNSTCQIFSAVTGRHADTATTIGQGGMPPTTEGCGTHPVHNHYRLTGGKILANRVNNGGWMSCCSLAAAFASRMGRAVSWTETLNPDRVQNSTCVVIESVGTSRWVVDNHSVSGQAGNIPLNRNQFYDLWNESCLNGWAMGNLAVAPADHARLFHLLFTGGLVSASDLKVMTRFKQLRHGWGVGLGYMGYGMGLMNFSGHLPGPGNLPQGWTRQFGHGGVDWGSGLYQMSGWFPDLNVSIVLATNALTSMNFSVGAPRLGMFESQWIPCNVLDTVAQHLSTFPKLNCSDVT